MLDFKGDAIVLSGVTGTKIKSEILGDYYRLWWNITSGGERNSFAYKTSIIELNAATGEAFIEDTGETILGSSGHALQLKGGNSSSTYLNVILVEEDAKCYAHLKNVIKRNWPRLRWTENVSGSTRHDNVYLLNMNLVDALKEIEKLGDLGNALFFFDPLLYTPWEHIENVARSRIQRYYQTGTEFIVFLFTSDWITGRGEMVALPRSNDPKSWTKHERMTVEACDMLFGHSEWRARLLNNRSPDQRIQRLVDLYKERLNKWFRYVVPFPFEPKPRQRYHLFMCSNYEVGVRITRGFYAENTGNPKYSPDNRAAYAKFIQLHKDKRLPGTARCDEWKILWAVITDHEEGICDSHCKDIVSKQPDLALRQQALEWLAANGYITKIGKLTDAWENVPDSYKLNWDFVKAKLGVAPPAVLKPLSLKRTG